MIITAPVTDYIPASILTTQGDIVQRGAAQPQRLAAGVFGIGYRSGGIGALVGQLQLAGAMNTYLKGTGLGANPNYRVLALRDTGIHIGTNTRNVAGNQVITGVGFESSVIIFVAVDSVTSNQNWSIGFDNEAVHQSTYRAYNGTAITSNTTNSLTIVRDISNMLLGLLSAIGADGFTITWTLTGACSLKYMYLCLP